MSASCPYRARSAAMRSSAPCSQHDRSWQTCRTAGSAARFGSGGRTRPAPRSRTAGDAWPGTARRVPRGGASRPGPGSRECGDQAGAWEVAGPCLDAGTRRRAVAIATCSAAAGPALARTRLGASIRTAQNLNSGIFPTGSISSIVSRLAAASRKWNGMKQLPRVSRCEKRVLDLDRAATRAHPGQVALGEAEAAASFGFR